jgi:DNA-binding transcriptional MerR regulator
MTGLTITDTARRLGIRASAIRYYEEIGLLPPVMRVNGRRRYDPQAMQVLLVIQIAQKAGFRLAEIRELLYDFPAEMSPSDRWRILAPRKMAEIESQAVHLQKMKTLLEAGMRCQCTSLDTCLFSYS